MDHEIKDQLNEHYVSIPRLLKGSLVRMHGIGTELIKEQQLLGDKFADFVRTQLPFDLREAQLFMAVAATPGLEAAKFTPAIEVKLPRLLDVMGQVVGIWATINDGSAPGTQAGVSTATSDEAPATDCEGSAEAPVIDNDAQAGTNDTTDAGDPAADQEVAAAAITDILSGTTAPVEQADAPANGAPAAVEKPIARQPAITAEQRKFLAEHSVTLLVNAAADDDDGMVVVIDEAAEVDEDGAVAAEETDATAVPVAVGAAAEDDSPRAVYRELLEKGPDEFEYLVDHLDEIVGQDIDPQTAKDALGRIGRSIETLREAEEALAGVPA